MINEATKTVVIKKINHRQKDGRNPEASIVSQQKPATDVTLRHRKFIISPAYNKNDISKIKKLK